MTTTWHRNQQITGIWRQRTEKLPVSEIRQESHAAVCFMATWSGFVIDLGKKPPPLLIQEPDGPSDDMRQWGEGQEVITWALIIVNTSWSEPVNRETERKLMHFTWAHVERKTFLETQKVQLLLSGKSDLDGSNGHRSSNLISLSFLIWKHFTFSGAFFWSSG